MNQRKELACKRSTRAAPCCCAGCCCSKLFRVQRLLHKRDGCRPQLRIAGRTWALRAVQGQHLHQRQMVLPVMQSSSTSAALGVTPPNTWQLLKPEPEASLRQESRTKNQRLLLACLMHHAQQTCANQIGRGKQIPTQKGKTRCTQIQIGSKSRRTKGREGFLSHEFVVQSLNPPSQILTLEERRKKKKQNENTQENRRGDGN